MIAALFFMPATAGLLAFILRSDVLRRWLLVLTALGHLTLSLRVWFVPSEPFLNGWFSIDTLSKIFLTITSVLFCSATFYGVGYLARESRQTKSDLDEEGFFNNAPEAVFTGCLLFFLATMTIVLVSRHFGILWVGMELTTLVSAPLIYFHRHQRSLEATWKYLLICSVGIALALLGNLFLSMAGSSQNSILLLDELMKYAKGFNLPWLKAAFIFFFVGYGTKMGLAPFHTWLPDAHSEAPSIVSALLSGALLNCAFLGLLRSFQVCAAAGIGNFCQELFLVFGLLSMIFAALFILRQADYKRMLAYSSIEHMGIAALGIGLGGSAIVGSLFHVINHSLTKALLFFVAGNILSVYKTKSVSAVSGVLKILPKSGMLWLVGFFAITGTPPFSVFFSKIVILKAALDLGHPVVAAIFLGVLAVIFLSMAMIFVRMAQGEPPLGMGGTAVKETASAVWPPFVFCLFIFLLGIYLPTFLRQALEQAALLLEGF